MREQDSHLDPPVALQQPDAPASADNVGDGNGRPTGDAATRRVQTGDVNYLNELGEKIFLDRYALKDMDKSHLSTGDVVVVCTDTDTGQREIGNVERIDESEVSVTLSDGQVVTRAREHVDRPVETHPDLLQARVARGIAAAENGTAQAKWEERFRWLLEGWKFVPGGRILAAAGTDQALSYYNCYVVPNPHDSRDGIIHTLSQMTEIMSRGGGVGINLSSLRPRYAYVKGVNGRSSGSVSWGSLYSFVTGLIEQGGSRRGALMLILNVWHPDVAEFINAKREMGRITNANISVGITDEFMDAVDNDAEWPLVFPDATDPAYDDEWDGDLAAWLEGGHPIVEHKRIRARELWNTIIESAWASAEPGLWFAERANKMSNSHYYAPLVCTNPCVTGDAFVYTSHGLVRARELFESGMDIDVVVDSRRGLGRPIAPASHVFHTGRKRVYRLQTREGYSLRATADHRIMTERGWAPLRELAPGDQVHILNRRGAFGPVGSLQLGRTLGSARVGSACLASARLGSALVGSARLAPPVEARGLVVENHCVPESVFKGSAAMQSGFLQALFTADGSFQDGGHEGGSARLASSVPVLLEGVQLLLLNFGIASRIHREQRSAGHRPLPENMGGGKGPGHAARHELIVSKRNLVVFARRIGFLTDDQQSALENYVARGPRAPYAESFLATVQAVIDEGVEDVFDLTEPQTHSFVANGIVAHNCGEQSLPGWSVCNLGAINLSRFSQDGHVDWEELRRTVRYAVRFLDDVIDITPYFFDENRDQQLQERRIGLGTMGLAELMIEGQVRYGSQ
jgi:ribonucleoside-diphosphate reductase alpha chain